MAHLIDKDALVAEIERRINFNEKLNAHSRLDECYSILSFLNTLEVKEEILDKEGKTKLMQKCVHKAYKRGYDMGVLQTTNKINHNMKEVDLEEEIDKEIKTILRYD